MTTQSQHPAKLVSPGGMVVEILERDRAHKWLGCVISTHTDGSHGLDLEHHLQGASRAFCANKSILSDKSVSIAQRLAYFDGMVTPVACFASGHRKIYNQDLRKLDVKFRKVVRAIVGAPGGLDRSAPWHHILQEWNVRSLECAEQAGVKLWCRRCLEQHWKLASYIANLSDNRWWRKKKYACVDCRTPEKDWKTNKHIGCANTKVLPMAKFGENGGPPQCRQIFGRQSKTQPFVSNIVAFYDNCLLIRENHTLWWLSFTGLSHSFTGIEINVSNMKMASNLVRAAWRLTSKTVLVRD